MNDQSNPTSTDNESESISSINGSTQVIGSTQVSTSTQGSSQDYPTQVITSTQRFSNSTQQLTPDDPTPPSLTPTVPQKRRGRPIQTNAAPPSSHSRSSSTSSSTRSSARRRMSSDSQLSTPSTASSLQTPQTSTTTSTRSSIRDTARITSISTGRYHNVTHEHSAYNINYRRQHSQSTGTNTNIRDVISDAMMPSTVTHAPNSPVRRMQNLDNTAADTTATYQCSNNDNQTSSATEDIEDNIMQSHLPPAPSPSLPYIGEQGDFSRATTSREQCQERLCVCLDKVYPKNCSSCQPDNLRACAKHVLIKCNGQHCQLHFHKICICHLLRIDLSQEEEINSYLCMECTCKKQADVPEVTRKFDELDLSAQMFRLGLIPEFHRNSHSARNDAKSIKTILRDMQTCLPEDRLSQFKDTHPLPYPSAVKMNDNATTNHVVCGRRFEISMMLFDVQKCHCCGRVQPCHMDSLFDNSPSPPPFNRQHLVNKLHKAWHCTCWGFCNSSQFFAAAKPSHITEFKRNHNGLHPKEVLHVSEPNAWICNSCYHDHTLDQVKSGGKLVINPQTSCYSLLFTQTH